MNVSVANSLASLPKQEREAILSELTAAELESLEYEWRFWARPNQVAPEGGWMTWLALAGRGFGKTEAGAQWIKERVANGARSIALVAETQKDLEEVMVARLLSIYPDKERPTARFKPVRITWPNGATALGYNGTEPSQLRGPEFDTAWVDELAKYRYARETWDMLQFTMRRGDDPRVFVTTTPRPIAVIKEILGDKSTVITRGSTFDNSDNLPKAFLDKLKVLYGGSRLGRQELYAEVLSDLPGAIWAQSVIDAFRVDTAPEMGRTVISVDPAVTNTETSDAHGIIAAGIGPDQVGYVLEDISQQGSPMDWARAAIALSKKYNADGVVVEVNQGGDMVAHTLRAIAPSLNVIEVRASRGKHIRAEPIAALYEQGRVRHVGQFPELENEMTQFTTAGYMGEGSPDRTDALVWAMTELFPDMIETVPDVSRFEISGGGAGWMRG